MVENSYDRKGFILPNYTYFDLQYFKIHNDEANNEAKLSTAIRKSVLMQRKLREEWE